MADFFTMFYSISIPLCIILLSYRYWIKLFQSKKIHIKIKSETRPTVSGPTHGTLPAGFDQMEDSKPKEVKIKPHHNLLLSLGLVKVVKKDG